MSRHLSLLAGLSFLAATAGAVDFGAPGWLDVPQSECTKEASDLPHRIAREPEYWRAGRMAPGLSEATNNGPAVIPATEGQFVAPPVAKNGRVMPRVRDAKVSWIVPPATRLAPNTQSVLPPIPREAGQATFYFDYGASTPRPIGEAVYADVIEAARDPNAVVIIEGHTDGRFKEADEMLGMQRAQSIAKWLVEQGVPMDGRIRLMTAGALVPAVEGKGPRAAAANRRVNLKVVIHDGD